MDKQPQYKFSRHARERWQERFQKKVREANGNVTGSLAAEFYSEATPEKSIRNNTRFMTGLYDKYGYDGAQFEFFVSAAAVFVCREQTLITVYEREGSLFEGRTDRFGR